MSNFNKKKKFVADGVFHAELHQFLSRALSSSGYAGLEIRNTTKSMDIVVRVTNIDTLTDKNYRKYNELLSLMHKRFGFADNYIKLKLQPVEKRGLCASTQVENLKVKLLKSTPSRTASQAILRAAEMSGAKGCEVVISGKVRQQRAKSIKYKWGYLVSTGQPKLDHVDVAIRHVFFKQGILGVKVKIMRPVDPSGRFGSRTPLPDTVEISDPKEHDEPEIRKMQATAPPQQTPAPQAGQPAQAPAPTPGAPAQ